MASTQLFQNRASSLLATSITTVGQTTFSVATGDGVLFPNPGANQFFLATLEDASGATEVVKVTGRATDTFTVVRGQEGTAAALWTQNVTRVELRSTAGTLERFLQRDGDQMTDDLDMNGNDVVDPVISGSGAKMIAGEIVNVPIRGVTGGTGNQLTVPVDGTSRAQAGGAEIATRPELSAILPVRSIIMWYGALVNRPSGWESCDGSTYGLITTPDLRDRFVSGVGVRALGDLNGGVTGTSGSSGAHSHTGATGAHTLSIAEMPAHDHRVQGTLTGNQTAILSAAAEGFCGIQAGAGDALSATSGNGTDLMEATGGGGSHTHTISAESNHTHTVPLLEPANFALYFLMRVV